MHHPFANIGVSNEILVNAEAQGLVVRAADLDMYYDDHDQATPEKDAERIRKVEAAAAQAKQVYDELANEYGINIPKFMYVVGEARYITERDATDPDSPTYISRARMNTGKPPILRRQGDSEPMIYTVSERIVGGAPLSNLRYSPEKPSLEDYVTVYETMTRYVVDKYLNHQPFFSDFGGMISMREQFMFGHIENQDDAPGAEYTNQVWLTDVDPKVFDPEQMNDEELRQNILQKMLFTIIHEVKELRDVDNQQILGLIRGQVQRLTGNYPEVAENLLNQLSK